MTRFKELERIEAALESGAAAELEWAVGYCQARVEISPSTRHQRAWQDRLAKVRKRIEAAANSSKPA